MTKLMAMAKSTELFFSQFGGVDVLEAYGHIDQDYNYVDHCVKAGRAAFGLESMRKCRAIANDVLLYCCIGC